MACLPLAIELPEAMLDVYAPAMENWGMGAWIQSVEVSIVLLFVGVAGVGSAQTFHSDFELAVRQSIPEPARCGTTAEPLFYCRSHPGSQENVYLELSAAKNGFSASLTYNDGEPMRAQLLAIVQGFFGSVGVDAKSFERCVRDSQTGTGAIETENVKIDCRFSFFNDSITHEIFAERAVKRPETPGIGENMVDMGNKPRSRF